MTTTTQTIEIIYQKEINKLATVYRKYLRGPGHTGMRAAMAKPCPDECGELQIQILKGEIKGTITSHEDGNVTIVAYKEIA